MPEALSASVAILDAPYAAPAANTESLEARVLEIYAATLARSLSERSAFETAVCLYRDTDRHLPEDSVRRAVANIICRKP